MSQCPHCQAEYEEGQRYCKVCGSYLLHRETGDTFCPQCGIRVSPLQEFCHECDAPLKRGEGEEIPAPIPEEPSPTEPPVSEAPAKRSQPLLIGLLGTIGVLVVIILVLLLTRPKPTAPPVPAAPPKAEAPATPTTPPTPAPPVTPPEAKAPTLADQLKAVLSKMREARLNKDIIQLMNCYSVTLPGLEEKRSDTLQSWENYDYTNLVFTLDDVQPLDADNANAKVTWYVDIRNRRTGELISSTQTFQVRFAKELGQWRIRSVEEVE